jgi:antitoxin StbD
MHSKIYADYKASITELKRNPQALINDAKGEPIALLNHNRATAYIVPAETFEWLMELAEDLDLGQIIENRNTEKDSAVEVGKDEL